VAKPAGAIVAIDLDLIQDGPLLSNYTRNGGKIVWQENHYTKKNDMSMPDFLAWVRSNIIAWEESQDAKKVREARSVPTSQPGADSGNASWPGSGPDLSAAQASLEDYLALREIELSKQYAQLTVKVDQAKTALAATEAGLECVSSELDSIRELIRVSSNNKNNKRATPETDNAPSSNLSGQVQQGRKGSSRGVGDQSSAQG
jgi:hypothetical protein